MGCPHRLHHPHLPYRRCRHWHRRPVLTTPQPPTRQHLAVVSLAVANPFASPQRPVTSTGTAHRPSVCNASRPNSNTLPPTQNRKQPTVVLPRQQVAPSKLKTMRRPLQLPCVPNPRARVADHRTYDDARNESLHLVPSGQLQWCPSHQRANQHRQGLAGFPSHRSGPPPPARHVAARPVASLKHSMPS